MEYMEVNLSVDSDDSSVSDEEEFQDEDFAVDFIEVEDDHVSDDEQIYPRLGGYEYEFVDEVSPNQKCPVCLLPMKDPVQTSDCGHRFCRVCLNGILRSGHPVCPVDRREVEEDGGFFTDKAWARDILSLRVKCQQNVKGCDWTGELRHAEDHQAGCLYEDIKCSACEDNLQRRLLDTHLREECPKRIVECDHCTDEFFFAQKQEHEERFCKRFPLICANDCGQEGIPREEMSRHISEKCPVTIVSCLYAGAGCPFQDKRAHLNEHMEATVDDHLEMTWLSLVQTKRDLDNMKDVQQKFQEVQEINSKMSESLEKMTEFVADCRAEIRDLSLEVKTLKVENIQQKKLIEDMARKTAKEIKSVESKVLARTRVGVVGQKPKYYESSSSTLDRPVSWGRLAESVEQTKRTLSYREHVMAMETSATS